MHGLFVHCIVPWSVALITHYGCFVTLFLGAMLKTAWPGCVVMNGFLKLT